MRVTLLLHHLNAQAVLLMQPYSGVYIYIYIKKKALSTKSIYLISRVVLRK